MPPTEVERAAVRQGWIQTSLILVGMVTTVMLTFARLDAKADDALKTATRAESKAASVESQSNAMTLELTRIRTVLEERLPPSHTK